MLNCLQVQRTAGTQTAKRPARTGIAGTVLAVALLGPVLPAQAQLFNSPVDQLPSVDRVALRNGQVLVTGEQGSYTAKVLVTASPQTAWKVLTDYGNYSKFLPNIVSSKVLAAQGNRKVIEQVDERRVLVINVRSRIRSEVIETNNQRIDFRRTEGDVPKLDGFWKIEPVAPYRGAKANQVLITQVVAVKPTAGAPSGTFYSAFKSALKDNLAAIRREVSRRR